MGTDPGCMGYLAFGKREPGMVPQRHSVTGTLAGRRVGKLLLRSMRMPFSLCPSPTVLWNTFGPGGSQGIPEIGVRKDLSQSSPERISNSLTRNTRVRGSPG